VPIAINPDIHRMDGFDHLAYGIGIARKGWLEASNHQLPEHSISRRFSMRPQAQRLPVLRLPFMPSALRRNSRLLSFAFQRLVLRRKPPFLASFKVTYRCNLTCAACPYHRRAAEPGSHMGWGTATAALKNLHRAGAAIVVFEGGEPFLWQDGDRRLEDLISYARRLFFRVAVTTNGTYPLPRGDILWVSLDGLKENQDRLRSRSFDRVWTNLQACRHKRLFVHFTLNRENFRDVEPLLGRLQSIPAFRGMTLQLFYPYGQGEAPLALNAAERREALLSVIRLKERGLPILNSSNRLRAMISNNWRCYDDILINCDPDGTISRGCYVKGRGKIHCRDCGFTPVARPRAP
jgi:MoaA/NifB/PqqE/SkfB family radical SAM enzyme